MIVSYIAYDIVLKTSGVFKAKHTILDYALSFLSFFLGYLFVRYADRKIKTLERIPSLGFVTIDEKGLGGEKVGSIYEKGS